MKLRSIGLILIGMLFLVACDENEQMQATVEKPDCSKIIQQNMQQSKNNYARAQEQGTYPMPYYASVANVKMAESSESHLLCTADTTMSDGKLREVRYQGTLYNGGWSYQAQYGSSQ